MFDSNIIVNEFDPPCYYIPVRTNTLEKKYETSYPTNYGLNSTTAVFL